MADIDQIIAGGAGASSRADFSGLAKLPEFYWKGKEDAAKNDLREAFKDGVPVGADGQPDFAAMAKTLFQKGGLNEGVATSNLGIQRDQLKLGQEASAAMGRAESGQPSIVSPPSSNRGASVPVAPPLNRGGVQSPQDAPQATVMKVLAAQGIPNDQLEAASASVARQLGVDPTAPIDTNDPQVRNVLVPAVAQLKRMGIGQVAQPGQPQQQDIPPVNPQQNQGTFGAPPATPTRGAVPTGNDPEIQKQIAQYTAIASNPAYPKSVQEAAKTRLEAIQKQTELTPEQKNYSLARRQGFTGTFQDYQNRTDDNTTQRDILTKSLLPKVDKSQESAVAARDDIDAIHRSREELDRKGGVFSGAFADKKLYLAKVADFLGVPNADKITNTESYGAAIGQRVAVMVKAFGSGTAISDGDRKFAANMAGGQVTLDENSMRRILDIGEKAARGKIANHNKLVDDVIGANEALKSAKSSFVVNPPGDYAKPDAVFSAARDAISKGAPRDAVIKRLKEAGHDPAKL